MTKRLLRSVIEYDQEISPPNLVRNFEHLRKAVEAGTITWGREDDEGIYNLIEGFFVQNFEMPSEATLADYFRSINRVDVVERLDDIGIEKSYARGNFLNLLRTLQEEQAKVKAFEVLKKTSEILMRGVKDERTGETQKGVEAATIYFTQRMQELRVSESNAQIYGDLRVEGAAAREEYQRAESDKGRAIGAISGIRPMDEACRGAKKGELWIHAAFPGELKCLSGDAVIFDHAANRRRTIKELFDTGESPRVTALEREGVVSHRLIEAEASRVVENGVREVYELTTSSGRCLPASANHRLFTPSGWRRLDELRQGDWVAVPAVLRANPPSGKYSDSQVKLVGYLLGDGSLTSGNLSLTASNAAIRADCKRALLEMGLVESPENGATGFRECFPPDRAPFIRIWKSLGFQSGVPSPVIELLLELDLMHRDAHSKHVPEPFFGLRDSQIALLLGALWSTDGSCHTGDHERADRTSLCRRNDISYASVSRKLCADVQSLLLRLGIQSSLTRVDTTYNDDPCHFYCLRVTNNISKRAFVERIKVIGKEAQFEELARRLPSVDNRLFPTAFIPDGMKAPWTGPQGWRYASALKARPACSAVTLKLFNDAPEVRKALAGDLAWERVAAVSLRGTEMTYDLSVPTHQTFVVNDIVTHNTMLACNWAYNSVTKFKKNVVYVSFEMTREQIRRSVLVQHSANARFALQGYAPLDYSRIRDGELTPEEKDFYFNQVIPDFESNPTYTTFEVVTPDREWTMADVKQALEQLHRDFEVGLVILDHGQWIEAKKGKKNKDYVIELNSVITDAKRLALNFDGNNGVPVLMLFQINRNGKTEADKNDGVYKMNALTYANNAEKTADVITTTYLNDELRSQNATKFTNLKNRDNPLFAPFIANVDFPCRRISSEGVRESPGMSITGPSEEMDRLAGMGQF
jgi:intein/homing endonuclease